MKEEFTLISLDERHRCNAERQLNAEDEQERTERSLFITQALRLDKKAIGQAEAMKLSRMTNTTTAIVHIDR